MILIDTSVLSRTLRRRRPGADERRLSERLETILASDAPVGVPGVVLQELLSGIRSEKQFTELEAYLVSAFAILHAQTRDYVEAARLRNVCFEKGLNVSGPDCLIATLAIGGGHQLFAIDEDFVALARHSPLQLLAAR